MVVMVQRPSMPQGETVADVETALFWLRNWLLLDRNRVSQMRYLFP